MKIGIIGLGQMGWPMFKNLTAKRGCDKVIGYDSAPRLDKESSNIAVSLAGLSDCDIIITMLPHGKAVQAALLDENSNKVRFVDSLKKGATIVDMSSSSPADTAKLNKTLHESGICFADAPVSGSVPKAEAGTLSIMLGCEDDLAVKIMPILLDIGTNIIRTGTVGTAHAMKSLNNYVYAAGLLAASEALLMGQALGLDISKLIDVMNASSGRNVATETKLKQHMLENGDFKAGFSLALMAKDLGITHNLKELVGFSPPQLSLCFELWQKAAKEMSADADNTEILRYLKNSLEGAPKR